MHTLDVIFTIFHLTDNHNDILLLYSNNNIGYKGAQAIAIALPKLSNLTILGLSLG